MGSPLRKRLPRELRNNLGKYLGMFLLLALAIAFTSGFLVAASSIELIGTNMRDDYYTEDGHFATTFKADDKSIRAVEKLGCIHVVLCEVLRAIGQKAGKIALVFYEVNAVIVALGFYHAAVTHKVGDLG